MNNSDVFRKSDLGREEIKTQSLGVLPREARTLLIMIDGKKTYQQYLDSLDNSKMFAEFGGIAPLFELLQEFQCIELIADDNASVASQSYVTPQPAAPRTVTEQQVAEIQPTTRANEDSKELQPQSIQSQSNSAAEFDATFNDKPKKAASFTGYFKRKAADVNFETLKSELATYIEKNAAPEDAWGYLLNLEQCTDAPQLLALIQKIQRSTSGGLSQGVGEFSKRIKL